MPIYNEDPARVFAGITAVYRSVAESGAFDAFDFFILVFCAACVLGLVLLIGRTRMGLLLRATTQNRPMAAALGVPTRRIDGWAFALGSGIAGMAGCALTLISNITPNMGQELVVDSFLVVVVGTVLLTVAITI